MKEKVKKPIYKRWWVWVVAVVVIGSALSGGPDEEVVEEPTEPVTAEVSEETKQPKEEPKEVEKTIDNVDISSEDFATIVKAINTDIESVEVTDGSVSLTYKSDLTFWDETSLVKNTATEGISLLEEIYKNESVTNVDITVPTTMLDQKGNESIENVIEVSWDKAVSDEINYENFSDMVWADSSRFYNEATSYRIHPGIFQNMKADFKNGFEHGIANLTQ